MGEKVTREFPEHTWNEIIGLVVSELGPIDKHYGSIDTIDRAEKIKEAVEEGVKHL